MNISPRLRSSRSLVFVAVLVICLRPATALAYIDPGTGSFVVQGIIAGIIGVGLAIKMFWHRIKSALTGKSGEGDEEFDE
jgi:hypothetical protein